MTNVFLNHSYPAALLRGSSLKHVVMPVKKYYSNTTLEMAGENKQ